MGRPQRFPREGRLRYQLKDFGKRALGVVGPLESLVSRFIVRSSASIAKSWLLPLGPLQEKTRAQCPLTAATRAHQGRTHATRWNRRVVGELQVSPKLRMEVLERCLSPSPSDRALAWPGFGLRPKHMIWQTRATVVQLLSYTLGVLRRRRPAPSLPRCREGPCGSRTTQTPGRAHRPVPTVWRLFPPAWVWAPERIRSPRTQ